MIDELSQSAYDEPRKLTLTYLVQCTYVAVVQPGPGGVGRAVEDACRVMNGQPNVIAETIKFKVEPS